MGVGGFAVEVSVEKAVLQEEMYVEVGGVSFGAGQGELDGGMEGVSPFFELGEFFCRGRP